MEEKQNPTPDSNLETPTSPPVYTPVSNTLKPHNKLPLALIIGIVLFLLIAGGVAGYYLIAKNKSVSTVPEAVQQNKLTPGTGSLYKDVAQRLREELK